ncbi:phakinin isoform X2 [Austrofundulus limnaeus]|uniref:Phakinin isoform X2 n=1 Tax=Austrofundulus limnaeus TaxID=52670 RepID=A0A2I4CA98_AUSLI|nr:PREDICTED: phakinin isoform X2 [Austrofundulus limnaeus]
MMLSRVSESQRWALLSIMPLPRRRSSFLGQSTAERLPPASCGRVGPAAPRGVHVGPTTPAGLGPGLGTRVSRRALGISSVFLQGMRSSTAPVLPQPTGGQAASGGLNSCLVEYRDKVRALEQLNQQLEDQIRLSLDRKASCAGAWGPLRREWEEVYRQVSEAILENAQLMLQTENLQANAEDFKDRFENEQPFRRAVEEEISSLYRVIDEAKITKTELEEQMENMRADLRSLEHHHEQDIRALYNQMAGREVDEPDAPIETSLDQILAYIRNHWEKVTEKNRAEADSYLECKEAQCVGSRLSQKEEHVEALKAECSEVSCRIQSLQAETESIRALKRGLENSLTDARHWHEVELQNLGSVVVKLEAELADVHSEIEQQRRDYDTLLSNKQRLEHEISLYHGILDGEENRYLPATAATTAPCSGTHGEPEEAAADSRTDVGLLGPSEPGDH